MSPIRRRRNLKKGILPNQVTTGNQHTWHRIGHGIWSNAGTTTQTTDGGPIQQWDDIFGLGHQLTQTTLANKPTLDKVITFNGAPTIKFQVSSVQWMQWPGGSAPNTPEAEIFIVFKATSDAPAANRCLYDISREGSGGIGSYIPSTTGHILDCFISQGRTDFGAFTLSDKFHILNIAVSQTSGFRKAWLDGVQIWNQTPVGDVPVFNKIFYTLCGEEGGNNTWDGNIASLSIFKSVLTSQTERTALTVGMYNDNGS